MDRQKTRAVDSRIQAEDKEEWAKETGYKIIDFYRYVRSQINLYRFEEGKIAETWQLMDVAGFMRQVGALTTQARARARAQSSPFLYKFANPPEE